MNDPISGIRMLSIARIFWKLEIIDVEEYMGIQYDLFTRSYKKKGNRDDNDR